MPRKIGYDLDRLKITIPAPIEQIVSGKQGVYQQINVQKRPMTVKQFRDLALSERYQTPKHFDYEDLERKYWKNITYIAPIYGADVAGTLTDNDVTSWNINNLGTILDYVNKDYGISIAGVNTAYVIISQLSIYQYFIFIHSINTIKLFLLLRFFLKKKMV